MANVINFNPMETLSGSNSFQLESQGYIQGAFMDDPVARMWLLPGVVDNSVTQAVWGGMPITESVPALDSHTTGTIASPLTLPITIAGITGFTVFNRAHNMLITPGNPVPVSTANMNIAYFRLGSNIRVPVKISTALATAVEGGSITQQVAWDFTNHELTTYSSGTALPVKVLRVDSNSKVVDYNSSSGAVSWSYGYAALIQL